MSAAAKTSVSIFDRSVILRRIKRNYWERLTVHGRVVLFGLFAAMMIGFNYDVPIYWVWSGAAGMLVAAELLGLFNRPRIHAFRKLPKHVCAGEKIRYDVELDNRSKRTAREIIIEEADLPPELKAIDPKSARVRVLHPRESYSVTLKMECAKRGVYPLPNPWVSSVFPAGLFKTRRRIESAKDLLVYPSFKRLSDFPLPTSRRYQPGGLAMTSDVGDSTEFLSTREYRYGDSIRDIHWASWARTGKPVVKEYQEEYFVRLAMLLDSQVIEGGDDRAFEGGISLAASIADVLSRHEYIIDIFAAGEKIHKFQAGRSLAHFDNILEILACIEHTPTVDMGKVLNALTPESGMLSALVCILMDWDPERRNLVHSLGAVGLGTRTIVVKDSEPTLPIAGEPNVTWYRPEKLMEAFS